MKSLEGIKVFYVPMTLCTSAVGGGGCHHILGTVNFEEQRVKRCMIATEANVNKTIWREGSK